MLGCSKLFCTLHTNHLIRPLLIRFPFFFFFLLRREKPGIESEICLLGVDGLRKKGTEREIYKMNDSLV